MGSLGASCFHTLSSSTRDLTKAQWDSIRFGQVCTSTDVLANWKAAIEELCQNTQSCTYAQTQAVSAFYTKAMAAEAKIKKEK